MAQTLLRAELPEGFCRGLEQLAAEEGLTQEETIRRAVALLSFARDQQALGRRLGFFDLDGDGKLRIVEVVTL